MKTIFFCEGFNSNSVVAQPWRHVHEIAARMNKAGHEVEILTDLVDGLPKNQVINGISVTRIKKKFGLLDTKELLSALNKKEIDVVNWYGGPLATYYFWKLHKKINKKIVWTMYKGGLVAEDAKNLSLQELLSMWNNIQSLYLLVPKFVIKTGANAPLVKKIIVWSKRTQQYLEKVGVAPEKISIISSGVDTTRFKPNGASEKSFLRESIGLQLTDSVLLYFGPIVSMRGAEIAVQATDEIANHNKNIKLLVLARDYDPNKSKDFCKNTVNKENIILLTKKYSQAEIADLLSIATAVVLPFKSWPHQECPLTVLEAMSMEKTVITTGIWPIREIVQDGKTGILAAPSNVKALSLKMIEAVSDKNKCLAIGKNAREYVINFHEWEIILNKTLDVLKSVEQNP